MKWCHAVNPEWLDARKQYLNASEIAKLLPTTPTGLPRRNLDEVTRKIWAEKQCFSSDDDIMSSGVMARGHILEPYALREFNLAGLYSGSHLHHWDDTLIFSKDGVSCSPDALDMMQPENCPVELQEVEAYTVGEVKCYNGAAHYEAGAFTPKMLLMERWQMATAFYTMPTLATGLLIFFNPSALHPLFFHTYSRAELATELATIAQIKLDYDAAVVKLESEAYAACKSFVRGHCADEEQIIRELLEEEEKRNSTLNP